VGWVQAPGVGEAEAACCRNVESEAKPLVACGAQDVCDSGSLYTSDLVPSGARGVLLKPLPGWLISRDFVGRNAACLRWVQPAEEIHPKFGGGKAYQWWQQWQ
jgi:hypothetical protein